MVQVHLSTSDVDIELSQYIKRELHSLHNYLLTSFTSQDIAAFSKHFAKVCLRLHTVLSLLMFTCHTIPSNSRSQASGVAAQACQFPCSRLAVQT